MGIYGMFLLMGNPGFIPSAVEPPLLKEAVELPFQKEP